MSQHLLNAPKVGALLEQMRGKGMTQRVRADRSTSEPARIPGHDASHTPAGQPPSSLVAKQRPRTLEDRSGRLHGVASDRDSRHLANGHDQLARSVAHLQNDQPLRLADVPDVERHQLAPARTRWNRAFRATHGPATTRPPAPRGRSIRASASSFVRTRGSNFGLFGRAHPVDRIAAHHAAPQEVAVKTSHRRKLSRQRGRFAAFLIKPLEIRPDEHPRRANWDRSERTPVYVKGETCVAAASLTRNCGGFPVKPVVRPEETL